MRLTEQEMRDVMATAMICYLNEVEGRRLSLEECQALVRWVDAHDFEDTLEVVRG